MRALGKRRKKLNTASRTMQYWRDKGGIAGPVERRIPGQFITIDLYGFVDVLVVHPLYPGTVYIQTTSSPHLQDRVKKILGNPETRDAAQGILSNGNTILVEGWVRRMERGKCYKVERRCIHIECKNGKFTTWEEDATLEGV